MHIKSTFKTSKRATTTGGFALQIRASKRATSFNNNYYNNMKRIIFFFATINHPKKKRKLYVSYKNVRKQLRSVSLSVSSVYSCV